MDRKSKLPGTGSNLSSFSGGRRRESLKLAKSKRKKESLHCLVEKKSNTIERGASAGKRTRIERGFLGGSGGEKNPGLCFL